MAKFASRCGNSLRFRLRFKKSLAIAVAMPWCTQLRTARQAAIPSRKCDIPLLVAWDDHVVLVRDNCLTAQFWCTVVSGSVGQCTVIPFATQMSLPPISREEEVYTTTVAAVLSRSVARPRGHRAKKAMMYTNDMRNQGKFIHHRS